MRKGYDENAYGRNGQKLKRMTRSMMLESEIFLSSTWMRSKARVCVCECECVSVSAGEYESGRRLGEGSK